MQEKVRNKLIFANKDSKTARSVRLKQTHAKLVKIRQKSARNWEPARNIFCPPVLSKSGGENRHLATLLRRRYSVCVRVPDPRTICH
jgi:hypothetical protein